MFSDSSVRRDQVEATNEDGEAIGKVAHRIFLDGNVYESMTDKGMSP